MNSEYLIILLVLFTVTFIIEKTNHLRLFHGKEEIFKIAFLFFLIGVIWDTFAIWRGHWVFPAGKTLGIKIGLMPIEEYLFILVIPYFVITVYKLFESKFGKER